MVIDNKCDGNRSKFARAINITPSYAAQLYANEREPSDRTISDVCRVFNVNKQWLLYGTGVKFMPSAEEDTAYINDLLSDLENPLYDNARLFIINHFFLYEIIFSISRTIPKFNTERGLQSGR